MPTVNDILIVKDSDVATLSGNETVLEAAIAMNDRKIGSVVVVSEGRLVGIFTERDILQRVVAQQRDAAQTLVEDVMTTEVACCRPHTKLTEARSVMKNRRIRHLPVVDDNEKLLGLISIGDLNAYETSDQESTIHWMNQYIEGKVY